jgi:hypothetical protein
VTEVDALDAVPVLTALIAATVNTAASPAVIVTTTDVPAAAVTAHAFEVTVSAVGVEP